MNGATGYDATHAAWRRDPQAWWAEAPIPISNTGNPMRSSSVGNHDTSSAPTQEAAQAIAAAPIWRRTSTCPALA